MLHCGFGNAFYWALCIVDSAKASYWAVSNVCLSSSRSISNLLLSPDGIDEGYIDKLYCRITVGSGTHEIVRFYIVCGRTILRLLLRSFVLCLSFSLVLFSSLDFLFAAHCSSPWVTLGASVVLASFAGLVGLVLCVYISLSFDTIDGE